MLYRVIIRKYDTCHNQLHEDSYFWGKCNHTRCKHFYWKFQPSLSFDRVVPHSVKHLVHVASGVDILIMSVCQTSCESKIIITSLVPRLHMKHISHGDWLSVLCRLHQTELTIVSSNLSDQTISGQIVYVPGQISECPYILLCPPRVHNIIIVIVMHSCVHTFRKQLLLWYVQCFTALLQYPVSMVLTVWANQQAGCSAVRLVGTVVTWCCKTAVI